MIDRAMKLVGLAVVRGVDLSWLRSAQALIAYHERETPAGDPAECSSCDHLDHVGEVCGAPKSPDGDGICMCALERAADSPSCGTATPLAEGQR